MAWIRFDESGSSKSGKTLLWAVMPVSGGYRIGWIKWHGPWRKYVFEPMTNTIWEEDCLRFIADFCQEKTLEHRRQKKNLVS